jgi:hypothetical protein
LLMPENNTGASREILVGLGSHSRETAKHENGAVIHCSLAYSVLAC